MPLDLHLESAQDRPVEDVLQRRLASKLTPVHLLQQAFDQSDELRAAQRLRVCVHPLVRIEQVFFQPLLEVLETMNLTEPVERAREARSEHLRRPVLLTLPSPHVLTGKASDDAREQAVGKDLE